MPNAVAHVLTAMIIAEAIRRRLKNRKIPIYTVLVTGIAGLLPDMDMILYFFLRIFRQIEVTEVHRTFTHTLFLPLAFVVAGLLTYKMKKVSKRNINISELAFFTALGVFIHLALDFLVSGVIMPFYPLSSYSAGLSLVPKELARAVVPSIDAILLVGWLVYEYKKNKEIRLWAW